MAKKKGRRSANVARKREKRKRDQKFRQKQIAVEKQRRLRYEKSEEEHLHACIAESRKLLLEPELEGVLFDPELMYTWVMELLNDYEVDGQGTPTAESVKGNQISAIHALDETAAPHASQSSTEAAEQACESFRLEILPHLVTPEFMKQLRQALTACETRLKSTGNHKLADVAHVTHSLFEAAPPEILAFHPMIQTIGIETLRVLVEEQDVIIEWREGVKEILSDVLEHEHLETDASQKISAFSDSGVNDKQHKNVGTEDELTAASKESTLSSDSKAVTGSKTSAIETIPQPPPLSPDELPARALYKNFDGLGIKGSFETQTDKASSQNGMPNYALVNESAEHIEFVDIENECYVKVTAERLQLHARSEAELSIAMAKIEARCPSALMYLAKTIEERG